MTTSLPHTHVARRDLSALTAGIPYLIGFPPTDSLVLFTFDQSPTLAIATTIRADLPAPEHVEPVAEHLVGAVTLNNAVAVLAVVVGGTIEEHRPLVDALWKGFAAKDILLVHASWVPEVRHGERWWCYLDPLCTDELPDPQTSTWAMAMAIAGDPMYRDRAEMAAQLAPDPPEALARREELLDVHLRRPRHPYTADDLAADVDLVTRVLTEAESSPDLPVLEDHRLVRLARALSHPEVRDECLAIALAGAPHAAERVWTVLIRALPAPERAEPAVLLAMSAYLRGAGVLAALAVRTALAANPAHPLALLLDKSLAATVPPHHLRDMLTKSILRNEGVPDGASGGGSPGRDPDEEPDGNPDEEPAGEPGDAPDLESGGEPVGEPDADPDMASDVTAGGDSDAGPESSGNCAGKPEESGSLSDSPPPGSRSGSPSDSPPPGFQSGLLSDSSSPGSRPGSPSDSPPPGSRSGLPSDSSSPGSRSGSLSDSSSGFAANLTPGSTSGSPLDSPLDSTSGSPRDSWPGRSSGLPAHSPLDSRSGSGWVSVPDSTSGSPPVGKPAHGSPSGTPPASASGTRDSEGSVGGSSEPEQVEQREGGLGWGRVKNLTGRLRRGLAGSPMKS